MADCKLLPATKADLPACMEILDSGRAFQRRQGFTQWLDGYPAESDLCSVTVFSEDGVLSDALSNACLVLGYEKSLPLLETYGAEGIFVGHDSKLHITSGLITAFELTNENFTMAE